MLDLSKFILYEDEDILAINKPAGLVVHPDGRTKEPSVTEWFVNKYPDSRNIGEPIKLAPSTKSLEAVIERPGVVHRIDRETSGVLLLAKTHHGFDVLKEQFQNRTIEKVYRFFVHGLVKDDFGSIRLPIGKSASDFRKRSAERGAKGEKREALTYYKVLKRLPEEGLTFVEAKPKTGRTHQIRVHFKALHHPLLCDKLYASKKECVLGFERLALHAAEIKFKNTKGEEVNISAPYPEDFEKALKSIMLEAD